MKCENCGCDNPKGCECCDECGASMTRKSKASKRTPTKRAIPKKKARRLAVRVPTKRSGARTAAR